MRKLQIDIVKLGLHLGDLVKGRQCLLKHRPTLVMLHDLGKIADAKVVRLVYASGSRGLKPADELHYG